MSILNDIVWDAIGNDEICENSSKTIRQYARTFSRGHLSFLGLEKRYGTYDHKSDGSWDRTAEKMLFNLARSGHPVFRGTSAWEKGALKRSKEGGNTSIRFNDSTQNIESVNQLSINGAVADPME